jgi:glycerophosphoryl diester phosphodiesterase
MRIAAYGGNGAHAPAHTLPALISGYTSGADVLDIGVQLTKDGQVVVSSQAALAPLTGQGGTIPTKTLAELRKLDFSATFRPPNAPQFRYYHRQGHRLRLETLPTFLDFLPEDVELLLELGQESCQDPVQREALATQVLQALISRDLTKRVCLCSADQEILSLIRAEAPDLGVLVVGEGLTPAESLARVEGLAADGLVTSWESVADPQGQLTAFGRQLEARHQERPWRVGVALRPGADPPPLTAEVYRQLSGHGFIWSVATTSMLALMPLRGKAAVMVEESFAGKKVNLENFNLGYAKANPYGQVFQDNGVHVKIRDYDGPLPETGSDPLENRLTDLETKLMYTAKDWPFYSGGGLGLKRGIRGDFVAEVDYQVQTMGQATTLEMAVLNVDPGAHQAKPPTTFRQKDSFFDPHGAPPYVGVEHDEQDGYRINWNLGTEYDNNQYGRSVGDGDTPRGGRLRLERRGPYFSAYYRNDVDAPDWVCVGVTRNDSLNPVVYLRCAGKRWRQEREDGPGYSPILANEFIFRNLLITRYLR